MTERPAPDDLTQLRKGVVEFCLLAILDGRPRHGYEIVARLADTEAMALSESTVYPVLARLRMKGLARVRTEPSERGPARKVIALTTAGRARLAEWRAYWKVLARDMAILTEENEENADGTGRAEGD